MEEELLIDEILVHQYYQHVQEKQLRDLNLLTELPDDYETMITTLKPKCLCAENQKPNL